MPVSAYLSGAGKLYVSLTGARQLLVVHPPDGQVLRILDFPDGPEFVAADEARGRLYVTSSRTSKLMSVDMQTHELREAAEMPSPAAGLAIDAPSGRVYVCAAERPQLYVVDPVAGKLLTTIGLSKWGFRAVLLETANKLYVGSGEEAGPTNNWSAPATVDVVDLAARRLVTTIPIPGMTVHALVLGPEGRFLYAAATARAELVRIDTTRDVLEEDLRVKVGRAHDIVLDGPRQRAYLSCGGAHEELAVVDLRTRREEFRIPAGEGFMACSRNAAGRLETLYIPSFNGDLIAIVDLPRLLGE